MNANQQDLIQSVEVVICYDECRYTECRYTECRYTECRYAVYHYTIKLSAIPYLYLPIMLRNHQLTYPSDPNKISLHNCLRLQVNPLHRYVKSGKPY
jgi:hypothetical protein